jgi:hypothetical protein
LTTPVCVGAGGTTLVDDGTGLGVLVGVEVEVEVVPGPELVPAPIQTARLPYLSSLAYNALVQSSTFDEVPSHEFHARSWDSEMGTESAMEAQV